ncbi:peptidoglycan-binding protein [Methylobacterium oryzihabitans]|uniref:Peptidoglycan-binding protein n=1 Tax=Methylobacterium oryzihabitans TaxID=2499852 RepID=A0A3S2VNW1_9HYPH|nr:peptidoglycan-binding protein [Methylobacterium oryzihabitans]RVU17196.1 peptidoglycan-binding protein [Methylobacterium oryzihabitans]
MPRRPAALLLLAALAAPAPAVAQAPRPPVPKPATPDPAFEAARTAFEARPEDERRRVQDALVWAGDYNSVTTGAFGRRTFEALQAWQAWAGAPGTGLLDDRERAALLAAGEAARRAAGFVVREDPATGLVLGVPERWLPKRSRQPDGTRWQSADGRVTLDSKAFAPGAADLDGLFERATLATPDRKVTYKLRRPDFLVVTGETATGKFYIRYAAGAAGVRGFTLAYDKALARDLDRLMIAIANSFVPFPAEAPPVAPVAASPPVRPAAPAPAPAAAAPGAPATAPGLPDPDAALVGVAAGREGGPAVAPGVAGPGGTVAAPLQPGAAGAPVLDRSGRLVGLVARLPARPRLIAGVMPPTSHPVVGLDALRTFLGRDGTLPPAAGEAAPRSAGAIAASVAGRVVAVRCGS